MSWNITYENLSDLILARPYWYIELDQKRLDKLYMWEKFYQDNLQLPPLLITEDGLTIDGNCRLLVMRKYKLFNWANGICHNGNSWEPTAKVHKVYPIEDNHSCWETIDNSILSKFFKE